MRNRFPPTGGLDYEKGTECFGDIIASDGKPLESRLAYLTQKDSLLPWLNVYDNVLLGYRLRNEKISEQLKHRACSLLEKVGLKSVSNLKPEQISSGMRQRAVLVRTLIEDRLVVLMDEPFSSLDVISRLRLQDLAATLLVNRTVLFVTHDPLEALRLGDNIYILNGMPAKITHIVHPQGKAPRDITDKALLDEQAKLFYMLAGKGQSSSKGCL